MSKQFFKPFTAVLRAISRSRILRNRIPALSAVCLAASCLYFSAAAANEPPLFFQNSLPGHAIEKMLQSYGALQGEGATLDKKTRELIALGVSATVPCQYCVYAHRRNALQAGATEAELREAVATAGFVRLWSAMFQGAEINLDDFMAEHDKIRAAR